MLKSLLINGLLKQDSDSSATQLALWKSLTIWRVAYKKLSQLYTSIDEVNSMIEEAKKELLKKYSRKPLALEAHLLKSICDHLSVDITKVKTLGDLDDLGDEIEKKVIELEKRTSKNKFKGNAIYQLIEYNLKKMFDDLSKSFKKKSEEEQRKIVKKIIDILKEMPDEQKEILRKKLDVDKITEQTIPKAISTGALGVAFATVVEIAGFSAYVFAVEALAAIAGIVGITLPFAAYTTLTSIIATFANPILIIPATLGLGYFLTKRANKQIRNALLPTIVTQIAVSASKEGDTVTKAEKIIRRLKSLSK